MPEDILTHAGRYLQNSIPIWYDFTIDEFGSRHQGPTYQAMVICFKLASDIRKERLSYETSK